MIAMPSFLEAFARRSPWPPPEWGGLCTCSMLMLRVRWGGTAHTAGPPACVRVRRAVRPVASTQ
eukprot:14438189-Alexandrium_andersonii.AAC.1